MKSLFIYKENTNGSKFYIILAGYCLVFSYKQGSM